MAIRRQELVRNIQQSSSAVSAIKKGFWNLAAIIYFEHVHFRRSHWSTSEGLWRVPVRVFRKNF